MQLKIKKKDQGFASVPESKAPVRRLGSVYLRAVFWSILFLVLGVLGPLSTEWQSLEPQAERQEAERLSVAMRNLSAQVNLGWHNKLAEAYATSDPNLATLAELDETKRVLQQFQKTEQVRGEISTFTLVPGKNDSLAYLATSAERQNTGTSLPLPKEASEMWSKGHITRLRTQDESRGPVLTLFGPLLNGDGKVVGGIQLDQDLQRVIRTAQDRWIQDRIWGFAPWFALACAGLFFAGLSIAGPFGHLKTLISKAAKDGPDVLGADPSPKKGDPTIWNLRAIGQKAAEKTLVLKQRWEETEKKLAELRAQSQDDQHLIQTLNSSGLMSLFFIDRNGIVQKTLGYHSSENVVAVGRLASEVIGFGAEEFRRVCEEAFSGPGFHEIIEQLPSEIAGPKGWLRLRYAAVKGDQEELQWILIAVEDATHARKDSEEQNTLMMERAVYRGLLRHPTSMPAMVASLVRAAEAAKKTMLKEITADEVSSCLGQVSRYADLATTIGIPHVARRAASLCEEMKEFGAAPEAVARAVVPTLRSEVDALNAHALELFQLTSGEIGRQGTQWTSVMRMDLEAFSRRLGKVPALAPVKNSFDRDFLSVSTLDFSELLEIYATSRSERLLKPTAVTVNAHGVRIPEEEATRLLETVYQLIDLSLDESIEEPEERAEIGKRDRARLSLEVSLLKAPVGAQAQVSLRLEDDGRGMGEESSRLFSRIEATLARYGGTIESVPSPGQGLKILVIYPLGQDSQLRAA